MRARWEEVVWAFAREVAVWWERVGVAFGAGGREGVVRVGGMWWRRSWVVCKEEGWDVIARASSWAEVVEGWVR